MFFALDCNNGEKGNFSVLSATLRSTEGRVSDLYINYVKSIGIAEFSIAKSFQKNEVPDVSYFIQQGKYIKSRFVVFSSYFMAVVYFNGKSKIGNDMQELSKKLQGMEKIFTL